MALPDSKNLVTVERLSAVLGGSDGTGGLWGKTKDLIDNIPSANLVGDNHITVTSDDTTHTVTIATDIAAQTAYTSKGTATKVPQITTNTLGQVTGITEVEISGVTPASHTHGNITNDGKVGSTADYAVVTTTGGAITATSLATSAPTASGSALSFIDSVSQNSKGKITATKKSVTVDSTYSATGTNPVNGTAIAAAIGTLDVSAIAGSASKTLTSISETDGKISATYSDIAIAQSQVTNLTTDLGNKAPKASPALTGTPTAPTADAGTNTTQIATTAFVKAEIDAVLDAADAMQFKGTIGSSGATVTALPNTHKAGWTYKVATAGTYAGKVCEIGDMIICVKDGTAAADADWTVVQNNIDGAVTGPASSVDARVAVFNGTSGTIIKDSGFTIGKSVPSDAVFTDTDTKVTSSANHYTPATASGSDKSASASGATAAWGIDVVKGVTLNTDGKGHVTGISVTSGKIPTSSGITVTSTSVTDGTNTFNKYTHPTTSGNKHIPSGGSSGQFLGWSADGTAAWVSNPNSDTKVTQTLVAADNTSTYPILLAPTGQTATATTTANFVTGATYKPSTNTLTVNVSGDAATASAAKSGSALETAINGKAASGHVHGNVTSDGAITASGVTIANGDALTIVDSSASGKLVKSSVTFDGSTTTQALTKAGTWATFNNYSHPTTSGNKHIPSGGSSGQFLGWSADGTAAWVANPNTDTVDPAKLGSGYGTCDTAAATTAKVGTLTNYVLRIGGHVSVKFTYAVPASATLNINSAGAKAIYYRGAAITAGVIGAGDIATFVYDGTQYLLLSIDSGEQEMTDQEVTDLLAALT